MFSTFCRPVALYLDRLASRFLPEAMTVRKTQATFPVRAIIRIYWDSLEKRPLRFYLCILLAVVVQVMFIVIPLFYKSFFDTLGAPPSDTNIVGRLFTIVVVILVADIFTVVSWRATLFLVTVIIRRTMIDVRVRAFDHVIRHARSYYTSEFAGSLQQRLARLQKSFDRLFDGLIFRGIPIIVAIAGSLIVLLWEEPLLATVLIVWITVVCAYSWATTMWLLPYNIRRAEVDSLISGKTADMFTNHAAIDSHGTFVCEQETHAALTERQMNLAAFTWTAGTIFHGIQELSITGMKFLVFVVGILLWKKGAFSVGMFMLLYVYMFRIADQLWELGPLLREGYESFADAKEMTEAALRPHEIVESIQAVPLLSPSGEITMRNVSFSHGKRPILSDISLYIPAGQRVGLVGPSGSGKSTFVHLINRTAEVSSGSILIDGRNIKDVRLVDLKRIVAEVPQDPGLFHRSLLENIRYGRLDATDEEVIHCAHLAHCEDFISQTEMGFASLVGERGIKLSGGERQRVAIARAFLKNAPILILDEATSSLDSVSENRIQDALQHLMDGRTTIVIAHRLSTIIRMDRILVMDKGKIVEDGTHDVLIAQGGLYAELWKTQGEGFDETHDLLSLNGTA